jgi:hypothetical protein
MKKINPLLALLLSVFSISMVGQSNLTLVMKEKADNAYFQKTEFNCDFSGFNNQQEATTFYTKMKTNIDVVSVQDKGKDATGNYIVLVAMKSAQNENYYLNWLSKIGVMYITDFKGEKKTIQEVIASKQKGTHNTVMDKH